MFRKTLPSQEMLKKCVDYDPETGLFVWKARDASTFIQGGSYGLEVKAGMWNARRAGTEAFRNKTTAGYYCGMINNISYQAHRVAWKLSFGNDPEFIDHINRDRADNRLENLRNVDHRINTRNHGIRNDNTSGCSGVSISKDGKWQARIGVCRDGRDGRVSLGVFKTKSQAIAARLAAEQRLGYMGNEA